MCVLPQQAKPQRRRLNTAQLTCALARGASGWLLLASGERSCECWSATTEVARAPCESATPCESASTSAAAHENIAAIAYGTTDAAAARIAVTAIIVAGTRLCGLTCSTTKLEAGSHAALD